MFSERETAGRMDLVGINCFFLTVEVVALFPSLFFKNNLRRRISVIHCSWNRFCFYDIALFLMNNPIKTKRKKKRKIFNLFSPN